MTPLPLPNSAPTSEVSNAQDRISRFQRWPLPSAQESAVFVLGSRPLYQITKCNSIPAAVPSDTTYTSLEFRDGKNGSPSLSLNPTICHVINLQNRLQLRLATPWRQAR